jgi:hypothetical protein
MNFWTFLFGLLLVIILIVSAGYLTQANLFLTAYKDKDPELHNAYIFSFSAAFLVWGLIALFLFLVFLSLYGVISLFGSEPSTSDSTSWSSTIFLVLALILIAITGGLAAATASAISNSPNYNSSITKLQTAYDDSLIAAGLSLGAVLIIIIGTIVYWATKYEYQGSTIRLQEAQAQLEQRRLELDNQQRQLNEAEAKFRAQQTVSTSQ